MGLSNKALLVNLNISQWSGKKIDKRATETVEQSYNTERKVGRYSKNLLPSTKELDNITNIATKMRAYLYRNTHPWFNDGSYILSSLNYMDFINGFRALKQEFDAAVLNFIAMYPALKELAKLKLGNLYDESDYPSEQDIQYAFDCKITFLPVPDVGDFRVEVLDSEKEEFLNSMKRVEDNTIRECYTRMHKVVMKAINKLNTPEAVFRDSLIENIQDICQLLPKLNVMEDQSLEGMRKELEESIQSISANACRENMIARNEAAKRLEAISNKMSVFMAS